MTNRTRRRGRGAAELPGSMQISIDKAEVWQLMSEKNYGSDVDRLALATREALQNSRDAIKAAYKAGIRSKVDGRFEVTWGIEEDDDGDYKYDAKGNHKHWVRFKDNGIGMTPDVMRKGFLRVGGSTKGGDDGGGFGVAKAAILSLSKSFTWKLHTRDFIYRGAGDIDNIEVAHAPTFYQGVDLTLYDVIPDTMGYTRSTNLGNYDYPEDRVQQVLAANNLAPQGSYPGVRVFSRGREVVALFRGRRAKILVNRLETATKTSITVRAYPRADGESGLKYVRLAGLFQFSEPLYGDTPVDLVIDIYTRLAAKHSEYPLPMSRNSLTGDTNRAVRDIVNEVMTDRLSSTKTDDESELLFADAGDLLQVEKAMQAAAERMQAILADPTLQKRISLVQGGGALLRDMQRRQERMQRRWLEARVAREEAERLQREARAAEDSEAGWWKGDTPETKRVQPEPETTVHGMSSRLLDTLRKKPKKTSRMRKLANPYAGFAAVRVNRREFNSSRLRPYFNGHDKWTNLALTWRFACQMILTELGRDEDFEVGFLFDDGSRAAYVQRDGRRVLFINPDWFMRSIVTAYKSRPLNIAAVLHSKAAHEVTHLLGYRYHNEDFVARREQVADETVGLLYPMATLVETMLGVKPAPTAESKELARLRKQSKRGKRNTDLVRLRRHLAKEPGATGCRNCRG